MSTDAAALPQPTTAEGRAGLQALLAEPARALVALDFDGTLAPVVSRPEDARPAAGAVDALRDLAAVVGTVAVITGRPVETVLALSGLDGVPGLEGLVVLGHYGLERWDGASGRVVSPEPAPGVERARRALPGLLRDAPAGVTVEDKHHSVVVHTRQSERPDATLAALTPALRRLAEETGLEGVPGRRVLELRPPGVDKGGALRALAAERTPSAVLFAGDDLGDLPAYEAVATLRCEGLPGVTVASASDEVQELAQRADLVVDGPPGVVGLLRALTGVVEG
ncbi:MAG: trehalose-phosphatase [Actinomycetota bacterium]|nr:trehalose-phosphatase [Actinomycetota bacterium]